MRFWRAATGALLTHGQMLTAVWGPAHRDDYAISARLHRPVAEQNRGRSGKSAADPDGASRRRLSICRRRKAKFLARITRVRPRVASMESHGQITLYPRKMVNKELRFGCWSSSSARKASRVQVHEELKLEETIARRQRDRLGDFRPDRFSPSIFLRAGSRRPASGAAALFRSGARLQLERLLCRSQRRRHVRRRQRRTTWRRGALSSNVDAAAFSATGSGTGDGKFGGFIGGGEIGRDWRLARPSSRASRRTSRRRRRGASSRAPSPAFSPGDTYRTPCRPRTSTISAPCVGASAISASRACSYATGGLAYGGTSLSSSFLGTETKGAGLEWMFARDWSAKVGISLLRPWLVSIGGPLQLYSERGTVRREPDRAQFNGHVVRAGLNYRFGSLLRPGLAKY